MTGRVRFFVPAVRRGVLETAAGQEFCFALPADGGDLRGGDVIEFDVPAHGEARILRCATAGDRHPPAGERRVDTRAELSEAPGPGA